MKKLAILIVALTALLVGTPALAQTAYPCSPPPVGSNGLASRTGMIGPDGQKWGNSTGQTWNIFTHYAACIAPSYVRIELHDTPYDHGLTDPSFKRRAEIGSSAKFMNGVDTWFAYSFKVHVDGLTSGFTVRSNQVHWPSGASPAIGNSLVYYNGGLAFRVTTKNDASGNVTRSTTPITQDQPHDVVEHFKLGASGTFADIYLDGKLVTHYVGLIGSKTENGYSLRLGNYGTLKGAKVVTEYKNIAPINSSVSLAGRIAAPPAF